MKKRNYEQPCIRMIVVEPTPILAGSNGVQGKTSDSEQDTPNITYGGDANNKSSENPDGSSTHYEVW